MGFLWDIDIRWPVPNPAGVIREAPAQTQRLVFGLPLPATLSFPLGPFTLCEQMTMTLDHAGSDKPQPLCGSEGGLLSERGKKREEKVRWSRGLPTLHTSR